MTSRQSDAGTLSHIGIAGPSASRQAPCPRVPAGVRRIRWRLRHELEIAELHFQAYADAGA